MLSSIFKNRILPSEGARNLFIVILAITVFYIIAFRGILFNSDHVYQNWDNGIPPFSIQLKHLSDISKSTWWSSIDMGTPGVWTGMTRYFDVVVLDGLSFLDGKLLAKWLYLFYVIIGGTGFWLICRTLGWGLWTTLVVILISQFNPKTYSLVISGHWLSQGFVYMLIPWLLFILYKAKDASSIWTFGTWTISAGIIGTLIFSATAIGIAYFGVFVMLFLLAFTFNRQWWRTCLCIITVFLIITILHFYWLVPVRLISQEIDASFKFAQTVDQLSSGYISLYHNTSPNFWNAIIGHADVNSMAHEYVYPDAGEMGRIWKIAAYFLLIIAVSGFLFKSGEQRNWKIFAVLCFIAGIILFAGDQTFAGRLFYEEILFKVKVVFFLMARTGRWLPVYYVGLAMMLGFALNGVNRFFKEEPNFLFLLRTAQIFLVIALIAYWFPYWSGSLTEPRNKTSQTLSLMSQEVSSEEAEVVRRFSQDKEDYRITVLPTNAGPIGHIPEPPKSTYTRSSLLLGKDNMPGFVHSGDVFSRFLLNLIHREDPYTDNAGRLLGLGAVKRIVQARDEKYYTYFDFGYMSRPYNIEEGMLFETENVLGKFLSAQKDIALEYNEAWKFNGVNIYKNSDFLPRIRASEGAYLASGGMPLFISMSEMPSNPFISDALFFGTDLEESSVKKLMPYWKGVVIHNNSGTELLLPFFSKEYWHPANAAGNDISKGWVPLSDVWHSALWLDGSPLNNGALISRERAEINFHLKHAGTYRVFVCYGRMPDYGGGVSFILNGKTLASVADIENNQRGFIWKDFGDIDLIEKDNALKVEAIDKGVAIRGFLIVPTKIFNEAMKKLDESLLARGNISIIAEAESVSDVGSDSKSSKLSIPLIHDSDKVNITMINAKNISDGTADGRQIVTEGEQAGEVIFDIKFGEAITRCKLEYYPRLYNDPSGSGFVAAYFSRDGINYQPISKRISNKSKRLDDIYGLRQEDTLNCNGDRIFIKFELRLAQLCSLLRGSYTPMRVEGHVNRAFGDVVKSGGQAVNLPASFTLDMPKKGKYNIAARMIGKKGEMIEMFASGVQRTFKLKQDGAAWLDMGEVEVKTQGQFNIKLAGSKDVLCDLFNIESIEMRDTAAEGIRVKYNRINPAKYEVNLEHKKPTLLLFSESYHPKWYLKVNDKISEPIKVFGFMNAYPIQSVSDSEAVLYFKYQPIREYYWKISRIGWIVLGIAFVFCSIGYLQKKREKTI